MKAVAILILVLSFSGETNATIVEVPIIGGWSCGEWVNAKEEPAMAWALGLLSGIAIGRNVSFLSSVDHNSVELWLDNYCKAHPLNKLGQGVIALFSELESNSNGRNERPFQPGK